MGDRTDGPGPTDRADAGPADPGPTAGSHDPDPAANADDPGPATNADDPGLADVAALGALAEPLRRAAYRTVVAATGPVGRDEVAERLGVGRTLAAFHLDRLVAVGLLEASYARRGGRGGPGAGRPAKLYRRAPGEVRVSVPPRAYEDAADLLAETVEQVGADSALYDVARTRGLRLGAGLRDQDHPATRDNAAALVAALAARGYEPVRDGPRIRLRNCPFHTLAGRYPPLVCGMNLALLEGIVAGAGWAGWSATIDPGPDGCCVSLSAPPVAPRGGGRGRAARTAVSKNQDR
jgi:predicted ArsR family transcriptional regulator